MQKKTNDLVFVSAHFKVGYGEDAPGDDNADGDGDGDGDGDVPVGHNMKEVALEQGALFVALFVLSINY